MDSKTCGGGGINAVLDLLVDNFVGFFERTDMEEKADIQAALLSGEKHKEFFNIKTGYSFVHDLPINKTLDEYYPILSKKYKKRAQRVIRHLNSGETNLLFYIDNNHLNLKEEDIKSNLLFSMKRLKNHYTKSDISIIYLFPNADTHLPIIEELSEDVLFLKITNSLIDFTHCYHYYYFYKRFVYKYMRYKFNMSDIAVVSMLKKILYEILKVCISIMPSRIWRQKMREKIQVGGNVYAGD